MAYGYGMRYRYRRMFFQPWGFYPAWTPPVYPQTLTTEQERQMLEQQAQALEAQIEAIKKRLEEIKNKPDEPQTQIIQPPPYPMFPPYPMPYWAPPSMTPEEELSDLEEYRKELEDELRGVEARISELKKQIEKMKAEP
jgi:DNA repair exonuclease SbcCD ATPase subunit